MRVALIVSDNEKIPDCNLIITNLPKEVTAKEFD
jgi:hypothetical protein